MSDQPNPFIRAEHALAHEITTNIERVVGNWVDIKRQSTTPGIPDPKSTEDLGG